MSFGDTTPVSKALAQYYTDAGLPPAVWHLGPEHPALEQCVIDRLTRMTGKRVLEIGVQAGGCGVPVIDALHREPGFSYTGVDNHSYSNAVPFSVIDAFLRARGVATGVAFVESDGAAFLASAAPGSFDVILLDHYKPLYPGSLLEICVRRLLAPGGLVLCHDVLGNAADVWPTCVAVGRMFGLDASVDAGVPEGIGELRLAGAFRPVGRARVAAWRIRVATAWIVHRTYRDTRAWVGRMLGLAGLR
ncbi:MAG: class I SAM-dependent methyltransferase [Vicinamibacterales bacterium]|nr:class I SAM-dependent methyltransferase [Vicinamibacterales bacterium]